MTLKELMLGNIQSNQATMMQLGTQASQKSGNKNETSAFGEILGSKLSSTEKQTSVKRSDASHAANRKSSDLLTAKEDSKPKFQTFREANENRSRIASTESSSVKDVKDNESVESKPVKQNEESKKDVAREDTPNNMIQALAQILGLDMKDVQKLLKEAGITSESFNNLKSLSETVSKLSQQLGLDDGQKQTLQKLLEMTAKVLNPLASDDLSADTEKAQDPLVQNKPADTKLIGKAVQDPAQKLDQTVQNSGTDQQSSDFEALLAKLNGKIKIRLNELGNELQKDQGSVEVSLKQILQPLLDKAAGKAQELSKPADAANEADNSTEQGLTTAAAPEATSAKNEGDEQQSQTKTAKEAVVQQPAAAVKETQPQVIFTVAQPDKTVVTDTVEKAATIKTPLNTKEIINQVIEKAKVILTPDKSEMIMDLKPDSLGKISLKVVTESGMVMAKFEAESQQVKQVLEANMQLLKDSLEKQGLNVQGFSVSVRQDSNHSAENWKHSDGNRNYSTNASEHQISGINGNLAKAVESSGINNPYAWGNSTINLSA